MYRALFALFAAATAQAGWIEYDIGPFHVISDAGDKFARDRLNEMEQLRHALGNLLGEDSLGVGGAESHQLQTEWPLDIVLFANTRQYAPHALKQPFLEGSSALLSVWSSDRPLPRDFLAALTRLLIDGNFGLIPNSTETALCDLFSTISVKGTKVLIGAPLPAGELNAARLHEWAKMQLLATSPEFSGKLRIYLNNLQGIGDADLATRNAYGMTPAQLDQRVDAYVRAGNFEAVRVDAEALNPRTDFVEKPVGQAAIDQIFVELTGDGKNFPPDSARGLLAQRTREAVEEAEKLNPRWAAPHVRLAELDVDPAEQVKELKIATQLEPRNLDYWQQLAEAQMAAHRYSDAQKSWAAAMRAAPTDADRARIEKERLQVDAHRMDYERHVAAENAAEIQRAKDSAAAEVHAAEAAQNKKLGALPAGEKPVAWWGDPEGTKLSGTLARVDCLAAGALRLTIKIDGGGTIRLLIRDMNKLTVHSNEGVEFACGPARPAKKINVIYNVRADAKLDTIGDIAMVEFP